MEPPPEERGLGVTDYDPDQDIEEYLVAHENKELLRFVSVGSVDDGKSTLIGRLLHDTHGIYEDQLSAVKRASKNVGEEIDFSLFTDGLKAEREQGITIDVAYRYFSTAKRKFIIADTPGHVQYTRNMATGASTANVGIILIDARLGVLQQSRRHAYIASLLGIPHLAVAVNKMDLKGYSQDVFDEIKADFGRFAKKLGFKEVRFLPISALKGDNVVHKSERMSWYDGGTLLDYLESVEVAEDRNFEDFRYPVQYVLRPDLTYRGFAAEIASGVIRKGDEVMALPSRNTSRITAIDTWEGEIEEAYTPMSVALRLEDEIDVSRGDMLIHPGNEPHVDRCFDAMLVWMSEKPLDLQKSYLLKHTTRMVRADVSTIHYRTDLETLDTVPAESLELNDIGRVTVHTHQPLYFDAYRKNRRTGAFILIDSITNDTVASGTILPPDEGASRVVDDEGPPRSQVSPTERIERMGQSGLTVWLTGLPGTGKSAIAYALERRLFDLGRVAMVLDPEDEWTGSIPVDGSPPESAREIAKRSTEAGLIAIFAFASPRRAARRAIRRHVGRRFFEVHVSTTSGRVGKDSVQYDEPEDAEIVVSLDDADTEQAAGAIVTALEARGLLGTHRARGRGASI